MLKAMAGNNENIEYVKDIEKLAMRIGERLRDLAKEILLKSGTAQQIDAVWGAQEYLKNYQSNQIKTLRDEFE